MGKVMIISSNGIVWTDLRISGLHVLMKQLHLKASVSAGLELFTKTKINELAINSIGKELTTEP